MPTVIEFVVIRRCPVCWKYKEGHIDSKDGNVCEQCIQEHPEMHEKETDNGEQ